MGGKRRWACSLFWLGKLKEKEREIERFGPSGSDKTK